MKLKKLFIAMALAVVGVANNFAAAGTTDLGALVSYNDNHQMGGSVSAPMTGPFDETYTFTINSGTIFNAVVTGWWGIDQSTFAATLNGTPLAFSSVANPGTSHLTLNGVTGSGSYSLHVTGSVYPAGSAQYGVAINAVPEPETFAMLLAGLGLIGAVVRRRNRISA